VKPKPKQIHAFSDRALTLNDVCDQCVLSLEPKRSHCGPLIFEKSRPVCLQFPGFQSCQNKTNKLSKRLCFSRASSTRRFFVETMDFRTTATFSPLGLSGGLAIPAPPPPPPLTSMPLLPPHIPPTTSMFMYSAPGEKY
jgi:hypothetical protein